MKIPLHLILIDMLNSSDEDKAKLVHMIGEDVAVVPKSMAPGARVTVYVEGGTIYALSYHSLVGYYLRTGQCNERPDHLCMIRSLCQQLAAVSDDDERFEVALKDLIVNLTGW